MENQHWETSYEEGYAVVVLSGATEDVKQALSVLQALKLRAEPSAGNGVLVHDVRESHYSQMEEVVAGNNLEVTGMYGKRRFLTRKRKEIHKAMRLSLQPNTWYFAEELEDNFPLVLVREVRLEKTGDSGDDEQFIELELYSPDEALPKKLVAASDEVMHFGLRPATEEDFENLDMILPSKGLISATVTEPGPKQEALKNFSR